MRSLSFFLSSCFLSATLLAQSVPLVNWTVPPYTASPGGIHAMTDISGPRAFVPIQPCRVVDTRGGGVFTGLYGPPIMAANAQRTFDINSAPHCPGIPAEADAYSLNFTVTQTAGASGDIRVWPTGNPPPPDKVTSVLNWTFGNQTIANATIMPAGTNGSIDVLVAGTATHLLIDINGYFSDVSQGSNSFLIVSNNNASPAIRAENSSSGIFASAVEAYLTSPTPGSAAAAIKGTVNSMNPSTTIAIDGLHLGGGTQGIGVRGFQGSSGRGVFGHSVSGYGVYGSVVGSPSGTFSSAGVRGDTSGSGSGVLGLTNNGYSGVSGYRVSGAGLGAGADLGFSSTIGLNVIGAMQASGTKNFVEPHPTDPSRIIRYSSLEGNEVGTYFRGRGKFQNGIAIIPVPEDFRIVTDPEGLSIQVTPIGQMATVAVESIGLDRVVVRGSRNVEFFYTVNGIRHAYKDFGPIAENDRIFVPRSVDEPLPAYLPAVLQERLISNGTYRPDGTVNRETAHRLGWDKVWESRSGPAPQPTEP